MIQINTILDYIPKAIEFLRMIITKGLSFLPYSSSVSYEIVAGILALIGAFYILKQFVTSIFMKPSTILNYLLIALLIYIALVYAGAGG